MRVAIVSGARSPQPMGLALAELRLLNAIRSVPSSIAVDVRVVGGRGAMRYARTIDARWIPARRGTLPRIASARADLVHLIGLDRPPPKGPPFVAMIHDLSPLHYDDEGELPPWLDEIVERAALLLTPSAFTASEVHRHLGVPEERIRVIGGAAALEARAAKPLSPAELRELRIEPPFVLRYGGYTKRKNVPLLLETWAKVTYGTLVLAGPPHPARDAMLANAQCLERVVVLDYVPQESLARLLRSAAVLVSTSEYEGFGLPPLEAMAAGTPVVAVSTTFAQEMCGEAAVLVGPHPDAIARGIDRVLVNPDVAGAMRLAGFLRSEKFRWERSAEAVLQAYDRVTA